MASPDPLPSGGDGILYGMDPAQPGRWEVLVREPGIAALRWEADGVWLLGDTRILRYRLGDWTAPDAAWSHALGCVPRVALCGELLWMGCPGSSTLHARTPDSGEPVTSLDPATPGEPELLVDLTCAGGVLWVGLDPSEGDYQDPGRIVGLDPLGGERLAALPVDRGPTFALDPYEPGRILVMTHVPDEVARIWPLDVVDATLGEPILELSSAHTFQSLAMRPDGGLVLLSRVYGGRGMNVATWLASRDALSDELVSLGFYHQYGPAGLALDSDDRAWALLDGSFELDGMARLVGWELDRGTEGLLVEEVVAGEENGAGEDGVVCW